MATCSTIRSILNPSVDAPSRSKCCVYKSIFFIAERARRSIFEMVATSNSPFQRASQLTPFTVQLTGTPSVLDPDHHSPVPTDSGMSRLESRDLQLCYAPKSPDIVYKYMSYWYLVINSQTVYIYVLLYMFIVVLTQL